MRKQSDSYFSSVQSHLSKQGYIINADTLCARTTNIRQKNVHLFATRLRRGFLKTSSITVKKKNNKKKKQKKKHKKKKKKKKTNDK
jgi:hypothetical protein